MTDQLFDIRYAIQTFLEENKVKYKVQVFQYKAKWQILKYKLKIKNI